MAYAPDTDTIIMFSTPWCGYCQRLKAQMTREGIAYREVNIEAEQQIAQAFQIQSIPLVVAFREGQLVNEFAGLLPEPQLQQWLETFLPSAAQLAMMAMRIGRLASKARTVNGRSPPRLSARSAGT